MPWEREAAGSFRSTDWRFGNGRLLGLAASVWPYLYGVQHCAGCGISSDGPQRGDDSSNENPIAKDHGQGSQRNDGDWAAGGMHITACYSPLDIIMFGGSS